MSRRMLASYLALALVVLVVLEIPLGIVFQRNQRQDLTARVERDAVAIATLVEDGLEGRDTAVIRALDGIVADYQARTGGRVVVVDATGTAVADSDPTRPGERSFASRPELARALRGEVATGVRHSDTLGQDLLYVAVPVASSGVVHGAVRVTYPTSQIDARVRRYWLALGGIAMVVLTATALVGWALARSVAQPLADVQRSAAAAGRGDLRVRAPEAIGPPEVQALAHEFNAMVGQLERLMAAQEEFVADASHQLRTPLTALRLRLENLEPDLAPGAREDLEAALSELARLGRLVEGLLALAGTEGPASERRPIDVGRLARERVDAWSTLAADKGVAIRAEAADDLWAGLTPGALEQVLDNLIGNAVEATPAGGEVLVAAARAGSAIELRVVDTGPGMAAVERTRAFDRFWTRSGGGGTGLGLAIVARLVRADGGEVGLQAAPGTGTEALVRYPAVPATAAHDAGGIRVPPQAPAPGR